MKWKNEIRVIYFHEFKLGLSATQTARNLTEVFGGETDIENAVHIWFKKFRSSDYDQLRALVGANPRQTVREVA
jgi:hypothetical protein